MATELENAIEMRDACREAYKAALVGGKNYQINGRSLTRYDLNHLRSQMDYWNAEVDRINKGMTSQTKISRGVPWG